MDVCEEDETPLSEEAKREWLAEAYQFEDAHVANWHVSPDHEIQEKERLTPDEWRLLRAIVARRRPELLAQLGIIGVRVQRPSERGPVVDVLLDEFLEDGLQEDSEPNAYGIQVDDLIGRLSNI